MTERTNMETRDGRTAGPRSWRRIATQLLVLATALTIPAAAFADDPLPPRLPNGLAMTPPMGWNSWNKFDCEINESIIRAAADSMVSSGMKEAGYTYVVIDDCWHGPRDAKGFITADARRFPSGIKALADYVHSKGLKFGIYSDAGRLTCAKRPGSQGHEYQDANTYASWGVDYLKYDWCNTGTRDAQEAYTLMSDALRDSGRDIVFSICEWGTHTPWRWPPTIGNLARTTDDINDRWEGPHSVLWILDQNEPLWPFAGPGHWNDPDMLEVGNGKMTNAEYRAHFSLWALMAAPLIAGNDLAAMDMPTRDILLNKDVIAIDQDTLGVQGRRVAQHGDSEVWVRPLAGGGRAVILFNRGAAPVPIAVDWAQLGYPKALRMHVRDLWTHRDLGVMSGGYTAQVAPHDVVMLRLAD